MKKLTITLALLTFVFLAGYGSVQAEGSKSATNSGKKSDTRLSTFSAQMKDATSNLKNALNSAREDFKENKEKALQEFKTRLAQIKDARKKTLAEKVNTAFNKINANRTAEFNRHLARLTSILDRIEVRKNKAKEEGKNVSAVEAAIAKARLSIATAQTAVNAQIDKDYTISFTNETNLGQGAKTTRTQLRQDLVGVWQKVTAAKQAVVDTFKSWKTVNAKNNNEATPSADVTPATGSAEESN